MKEYEADDAEQYEGPSKSELKREMHARQELGEKLVLLGAKQLAKIPLDAAIMEAITDCQRFKHREAKRRQMQFIGKLMRHADVEAIERAYQQTQAGSEESKKIEHKLEFWRDKLLAEGDDAIQEAIDEFCDMDRQKVRQLIRDAKKEQNENKPPAAGRKLFKYLKGQMELAGQQEKKS